MSTVAERLEAATVKAENASAIATDWANGPNRDVTPEPLSGPLPTIRKFLASKSAEIDAAANAAAVLRNELEAGTAPIGSVTAQDVSDLVDGLADGSALIAGVTASDLVASVKQNTLTLDISSALHNIQYSNSMDSYLATTSDQPVITNANLNPNNTTIPLLGSLIESLTRELVGSDQVVTAQCYSPHGLSSGQSVVISGANEANYNRTASVTVVNPLVFTYLIGPTQYPATPATGTIIWGISPVFFRSTDTIFNYSMGRAATMQPDPTPDWFAGNVAVVGVDPWHVEFVSNDGLFEFHVVRGSYRMLVDGVPVTARSVNVDQPSFPGFLVKAQFPTKRQRLIRIEFSGIARFLGVWGQLPTSISKAPENRKIRALMLADSFGEGTKAVDRFHSVTHFIGQKLGWDMINASLGSTGITTGGSYGDRKYINRLSEANYTKQNPDVVIVWGSVNDGGNITVANSTELFNAIKITFPSAKIVAFGPLWPTETPPATATLSATQLKTSCAQNGIVYVDGGIGLGGVNWINAQNKNTYYIGVTATATAEITGDAVTAVNVTNGGAGYDPHNNPPTVTLSGGGGSGAVAIPVMSYSVTDVQILNGGRGYTSAPTVTITNGGAAISRLVSNAVNSVTITDTGENYTVAPIIEFSGGGGSGATAVAEISGGKLTRITVTAGGSGYTSAPSVIVRSAQSDATATATVSGGVLTGISFTSGSGYKSCPVVRISGGGGSGAEAIAFISGVVASVTVTAGGSGYTSAPTVTIQNPNGGDVTHPKTNGHQMIAARFCANVIAGGQ